MSARVAVIIPCYNDGPLLREAVESIVEDEPIEVVIVDDHSIDPETLQVLDGLRAEGMEVLRHERNSGSAAARGTALAASTAPFVFPLDADDLAVPGALAAMADRLEEEPAVAACFGDYAEFGDSSLVRAVPDRLDPFRIAYTNEYPVSAMFRRTVLDEIGGWNGNGYTGTGYEDWNLWMTIAERADCCVHLGQGRLTYRRRLHGQRKLALGKRRHPTLYRELARTHPRLFAELASHRRKSGMSTMRKRLYPIVYGRRRRFVVERRVKSLLDRWGIWTLRR